MSRAVAKDSFHNCSDDKGKRCPEPVGPLLFLVHLPVEHEDGSTGTATESTRPSQGGERGVPCVGPSYRGSEVHLPLPWSPTRTDTGFGGGWGRDDNRRAQSRCSQRNRPPRRATPTPLPETRDVSVVESLLWCYPPIFLLPPEQGVKFLFPPSLLPPALHPQSCQSDPGFWRDREKWSLSGVLDP